MNKIFFTSFCLTIILFVGSSFVQLYSLQKSIERGKEVYTTYCQNCHMENGLGMEGTNPPVAKSDFLKRPVNELISVILKGQEGKVKVNGVTYDTPMLPLDYMTDDQIADALNYTRNSWGNKNTIPVLPAQVKKLRN
jgi:mono/diheme cytochrome c family protein